jgi:hypothetical protein
MLDTGGLDAVITSSSSSDTLSAVKLLEDVVLRVYDDADASEGVYVDIVDGVFTSRNVGVASISCSWTEVFTFECL